MVEAECSLGKSVELQETTRTGMVQRHTDLKGEGAVEKQRNALRMRRLLASIGRVGTAEVGCDTESGPEETVVVMLTRKVSEILNPLY